MNRLFSRTIIGLFLKASIRTQSRRFYFHSKKSEGLIIQTIYPPRHEALPSSFDRILKTRLPHAIVSALTGIEDKVIKHLRHKLPFQPNVLAKTLVQKRVLTRHAFNRYALFIAVCVYEILLHNGQTPLEAFLNTVEAIEHSPTINANKSDDCHLPLNLYHWLVAHGHFPEINTEIHKVATPEFFPENFSFLFDFRCRNPIPVIREMGIFPIPTSLDPEHKRLLIAINSAIQTRSCLKKVLHQYYEGAFQ